MSAPAIGPQRLQPLTAMQPLPMAGRCRPLFKRLIIFCDCQTALAHFTLIWPLRGPGVRSTRCDGCCPPCFLQAQRLLPGAGSAEHLFGAAGHSEVCRAEDIGRQEASLLFASELAFNSFIGNRITGNRFTYRVKKIKKHYSILFNSQFFVLWQGECYSGNYRLLFFSLL